MAMNEVLYSHSKEMLLSLSFVVTIRVIGFAIVASAVTIVEVSADVSTDRLAQLASSRVQ